MKSKFLAALAVLVGTGIGAGFLGIPYVVSKSGFLPGLAFLIFVAAFILFIKLYLGEVILRTRGNHQLTGYAEKYLGKAGKWLMFFAMIFGIYAALTAYLIGEGKTLSYIFTGTYNFEFLFSIIFFFIMAGLTFIGLKALKKYEKIAMFFIFGFVLLIFVFFISKVNISNLNYVNPEYSFLPFGVILFSFLAFSAMPEVERILIGQEKMMKRVILLGVSIPLIIYLIFTFVVVGCFGQGVQEIATLSLGRFFSLLGVLTMFTAFFTLTLAIRDMFRFDFNLGRIRGWLLAILIPLAIFLLIYFFKWSSFIQLLSLGGVVSGGLTGILILLMNKKAEKEGDRRPEYALGINWFIIFLLSLIFIIAVVLEFIL